MFTCILSFAEAFVSRNCEVLLFYMLPMSEEPSNNRCWATLNLKMRETFFYPNLNSPPFSFENRIVPYAPQYALSSTIISPDSDVRLLIFRL